MKVYNDTDSALLVSFADKTAKPFLGVRKYSGGVSERFYIETVCIRILSHHRSVMTRLQGVCMGGFGGNGISMNS